MNILVETQYTLSAREYGLGSERMDDVWYVVHISTAKVPAVFRRLR
jgi:hypothetical protein